MTDVAQTAASRHAQSPAAAILFFDDDMAANTKNAAAVIMHSIAHSAPPSGSTIFGISDMAADRRTLTSLAALHMTAGIYDSTADGLRIIINGANMRMTLTSGENISVVTGESRANEPKYSHISGSVIISTETVAPTDDTI